MGNVSTWSDEKRIRVCQHMAWFTHNKEPDPRGGLDGWLPVDSSVIPARTCVDYRKKTKYLRCNDQRCDRCWPDGLEP